VAKKNVRRAKRSGTRECPLCGDPAPLVEHHIHGRKVPRWREGWNVVFLCATCHDRVHLREFVIEGWFNVDGVRTLVWRRAGEPPKVAEGAVPPDY